MFAVFFTWSNRMVWPAAGFEITDMFPESTRVFPSVARVNRKADCTGGRLGLGGCNELAYSAVRGGSETGGGGVTASTD